MEEITEDERRLLVALGKRLRQAIETRSPKLTQVAVAEELGFSKGAVTHWIYGKKRIQVYELYRLAQLLDESCDWLLTGVRPGPFSLAAHRVATKFERLETPTDRGKVEEYLDDRLRGQEDARSRKRRRAETARIYRFEDYRKREEEE